MPVRCSKGHDNVSGNRFCYLCGEPLTVENAVEIAGQVGQEAIASQTITPGMTLGGRYQIKQELGQGGFGRTYLAEDTHRFQEWCVLKEFAPQVQSSNGLQKAEELFAREAGVLYQLQHPQIPRFRELFRALVGNQARLFLVQDFVEGQTYQKLLEARRQQGFCFSELEITQLFSQLLPVLHYIHGAGVIHRDISPDNVILRYADQRPVLIDFGGVKQVAAEAASEFAHPGYHASPTATRLGKVGYAPDEQMRYGRVFPHSDLYALAIMALVLLTGKDPAEILTSPPDLWKRSLSPLLAGVLDRMLDPTPERRFQSAMAVMEALGMAPSYPAIPPPYPPSAPGYPDPPIYQEPAPEAATLPPTYTPISPLVPTAAIQPPLQSQPRSSRGWGWLIPLVLVAVPLGVAWGTRDRWLPLISAEPTVAPSPEASTPDEPDVNTPTFSPEEQARKAALRERRESLGVSSAFLTAITNDTFYSRYPDQQGRTLGTGPEDADLRSQWDSIASEWLDQLENHLSQESRRRLGEYDATDRANWKQAVNDLYVSSRSLNDVTDAKFFSIFPDWRGQDFIEQPIGQVWQAIASDQVKALQAGKTLETIQIEQGQFNKEVSGTLQPGEGKVYLASLREGQILRVRLQATEGTTLFSIYIPRPTDDLPYLLEDSTDQVWSGQLSQSGYYELVIVSNSADPVSYQLNVAVDNVIPNSPAAQPEGE